MKKILLYGLAVATVIFSVGTILKKISSKEDDGSTQNTSNKSKEGLQNIEKKRITRSTRKTSTNNKKTTSRSNSSAVGNKKVVPKTRQNTKATLSDDKVKAEEVKG